MNLSSFDPLVLSVLAAVVGYLIGSLSFAVIVSRLFGLADPRSYGSGNPGATNVLRSGNKGAALATLLLAVVGAHLSGMPLNRELVALGARLVRRVRTSASKASRDGKSRCEATAVGTPASQAGNCTSSAARLRLWTIAGRSRRKSLNTLGKSHMPWPGALFSETNKTSSRWMRLRKSVTSVRAITAWR